MKKREEAKKTKFTFIRLSFKLPYSNYITYNYGILWK